MSSDTVADALLNLATCESSINTLSQILVGLHAIDALHRLKEKADVFNILSIIASFAPFLVPPSVSGPSTTINLDAPSVGARVGQLERRVDEMPRSGGLAGGGGRQGESMPGFAHTRVPAHPSSLDDRDDDAPPSSQSTRRDSSILLPPLDDYSDLLHGPRPSSTNLDEWKLQQAKTKPLYSFLVYFPILTQYQTVVTKKEEEMLENLILSRQDVGGASITSPLLSKEIYPRIRLVGRLSVTYGSITQQNVALVLDDNPERLRATQVRLLAAQRAYWGDLHDSPLIKNEASIFVRTWEERPSFLVYKCSIYPTSIQYSMIVDDVRRDPGMLVRALFERYPVLARFQSDVDCRLETGCGSTLCRLPGGGGRVHFKPRYTSGGKEFPESLSIFVPLFPAVYVREALGRVNDNDELEDFCEDFALRHPWFRFQDCLDFVLSFQTLGDPSPPLRRLTW